MFYVCSLYSVKAGQYWNNVYIKTRARAFCVPSMYYSFPVGGGYFTDRYYVTLIKNNNHIRYIFVWCNYISMTRLKPWLRETVIVIRTWTSDCSRWFYIDVIRYPCPHLKAGSASLWKWKRTWKIMYIYQSYHGIRTKFWRSKLSDRFFKHLAVLDINCFAVEIVISAGTLGSRLG